MSVVWTPKLNFGAVETVSTEGGNSATVSFAQFDVKNLTLNATSTPAISKIAGDTLALSGGTATIDLTTLTGVNGAAVDFTGLELVAVLFDNDRAGTNSNTGDMTIAEGASNGYAINGGNSIVVEIGGFVLMYFKAGAPTVAAADKTLDITGTGTEVLNYILLAG